MAPDSSLVRLFNELPDPLYDVPLSRRVVHEGDYPAALRGRVGEAAEQRVAAGEAIPIEDEQPAR